ncbi:MAG: FHA domain-containing protein [Planctomycetaceae bacterium]
MFALTIETGKHKGRRLRLSPGELVVGRDEKAGIRVASSEVSRAHCVFITTETGVVLKDLGSRNGTFVNGIAITDERTLQANDVIVVGPLGFRFQSPTSADKKSGTSTTPKRNDSSDSSLSDNDIASWLSDDVEEGRSGDTTIIPNKKKDDETTASLPAGDPPSPVTPIAPAATPPRKEFKTVAAEAADIIRRHLESQGS